MLLQFLTTFSISFVLEKMEKIKRYLKRYSYKSPKTIGLDLVQLHAWQRKVCSSTKDPFFFPWMGIVPLQ